MPSGTPMSRATAQVVFDRGHTVFLHQGKRPRMPADADLSLLLVDQLAELADGGSRMFGATQQLRCAERHFLGVIFFLDAISTTFLAQMLTKKLARVQMQVRTCNSSHCTLTSRRSIPSSKL